MAFAVEEVKDLFAQIITITTLTVRVRLACGVGRLVNQKKTPIVAPFSLSTSRTVSDKSFKTLHSHRCKQDKTSYPRGAGPS